MAKKKYPQTVDRMISLRGPYQYKIQIRKRGVETITATFETIEEARLFRDQKLLDIQIGTNRPTQKAQHMTLGELLELYAKEVVPSLCTNETSCRQLQSRIRYIKNYKVADVVMMKLNKGHLQLYRDVRLKIDTCRRKTVKEDLSEIRRVIDYAMDEEGINLPHGNPVNVRKLLKRVQNDAVERKAIRSADLEATLLKACSKYGDKHTLHDLVNLGLRTGMRRGQLVHLLWENIFLDESIALVINKNRKRDNKELIEVVLTKAAVEILSDIGEKRKGKVFCYTHPCTVTTALARIRAKPEYRKIPDFELITPHVLRHTAAFRLKGSGISNEMAMLVTGHKSYKVFDDYGKMKARDVVGKIPNI